MGRKDIPNRQRKVFFKFQVYLAIFANPEAESWKREFIDRIRAAGYTVLGVEFLKAPFSLLFSSECANGRSTGGHFGMLALVLTRELRALYFSGYSYSFETTYKTVRKRNTPLSRQGTPCE